MIKVARYVSALSFLAGCFWLVQATASETPKSVKVEIKNADGQKVGTATITEASPGVKIQIDITNLQPGAHNFHVHQHALCEPPDFKTAGGQHYPDGVPKAADPAHAHELPMNAAVNVGPDGTGHALLERPDLTLGNDDHSVFANGGTAIIFHTVMGSPGPNRVACAMIKKPE